MKERKTPKTFIHKLIRTKVEQSLGTPPTVYLERWLGPGLFYKKKKKDYNKHRISLGLVSKPGKTHILASVESLASVQSRLCAALPALFSAVLKLLVHAE